MLFSVREFLFPFNNKIKVTAIVTARLQRRLQVVFKTVFKPSSRPSGSANVDLAPRHSELQNCGFQAVCVAAVTPFVV